jgi:hypothetical protein
VIMLESLARGHKFCTSRNKRYGETGDTFSIMYGDHHYRFRLFHIEKLPLWYVKSNLYKPEGFFNPEGFEEIWNKLHPRKGYDPDHEVWVHWFHPLNTEPGDHKS